jgi:iron-sulfur cluster assembly accessory protein
MSQTSTANNQPEGNQAPQSMGPVSITEKAAVQVKSIRERENRPKAHLRVSVIGGGCSGLSYKLSFEDEMKDKDQLVEMHGVTLIIDPKSILFLKGIVVDFTDGLDGQGFVFNNPNAKQSCGCGTSFSA